MSQDHGLAKRPVERLQLHDPPTASRNPAPHKPDYDSQLYLASVVSGAVTRKMYGDGYDAKINEIALRNVLGAAADRGDNRAAHFCGFEDFESMRSYLDGTLADRPDQRREIELLFMDAKRLSSTVEDYVRDAWNRSQGVEVWNPSDVGHERAKPSEYFPESRGRLRFASSTRAGDRAFSLYFDSSRHPQLELDLERLAVRRRALGY